MIGQSAVPITGPAGCTTAAGSAACPRSGPTAGSDTAVPSWTRHWNRPPPAPDARACVRAPVYKALGVTPPACTSADPTAPLVKEVQMITNGDLNATRLKDEQFAAKANAIDYYYASMARAELAEAQIARAAPPAGQ